MIRSYLGIAAVCIGCLLGGGAAGAAPGLSDPVGDSGGAPDLTAVAVADYDDGALSIAVTAKGFAALQVDHSVWLMLDTDFDAATGSGVGRGADYAVGSYNDGPRYLASVVRWNGSTWVPAPEAVTHALVVDDSGETLTFGLNARELGIGDALRLQVQSNMAGVAGVGDYAPDSGVWTYQLARAAHPVTPRIGYPREVPTRPVAGKRFTLTFPVTSVETGQPVTTAKMVCDPRAGGRLLTHTESFHGGLAAVSFVVPKALKGKQLQVTLSITATGGTAGRTVGYRIK